MNDAAHLGPLHLQRYLVPCTDALVDVMRAAACHPVEQVCCLLCRCAKTSIIQRNEPLAGDQRISVARRRSIESTRTQIISLEALPSPEECRFFTLQTNDELGIIHAHCRRCERMILIYDRDLYWGVKSARSAPAQLFPHMCSCGSHTFEIAIGFQYPEEALDENDLDTLTVAVRCATCNEIAIVFDDEAT